MKNELFLNFLDKLGQKTGHTSLMEAVKKGFSVLYEAMSVGNIYADNAIRRALRWKKLWPSFNEKIIGRLKSTGCTVDKIMYADDWHTWTELKQRYPELRDFDAHVPVKVSMKIRNPYDEFSFDLPVDVEYAHIGNYSPLRRLGEKSNGKAAACKELADYQDSHRNTWDIPMSTFLDAMDEFAAPDRYLDDESRQKLKEKVASDRTWEEGMSEFYRTAKYQGD